MPERLTDQYMTSKGVQPVASTRAAGFGVSLSRINTAQTPAPKDCTA